MANTKKLSLPKRGKAVRLKPLKAALRPHGNPLCRYAVGAPSLVMREIANAALSKGLNQQRLAKAAGFTPPALIKHFRAVHPREDTVRKYARVLGISEYIKLVGDMGVALNAEQHKKWTLELTRKVALLKRHRHRYKAGTWPEMRGILKNMSDEDRAAVVRRFAIAELRLRAGIEPKTGLLSILSSFTNVSYPFGTLEEALGAGYELVSRPRDQDEGIFENIFIAGVPTLTLDQIDFVIGAARMCLKASGRYKPVMDERLQAIAEDLQDRGISYTLKPWGDMK